MGDLASHSASRFGQNLGGAFTYRNGGLTDEETSNIMADCTNL